MPFFQGTQSHVLYQLWKLSASSLLILLFHFFAYFPYHHNSMGSTLRDLILSSVVIKHSIIIPLFLQQHTHTLTHPLSEVPVCPFYSRCDLVNSTNRNGGGWVNKQNLVIFYSLPGCSRTQSATSVCIVSTCLSVLSVRDLLWGWSEVE